MWLAGSGKRTDGHAQSASRSPTGVASRKADHVRINLEEDVVAKGISSGFDDYYFLHCALPELNLDDVDPSTALFGRRLSAPLLISCMVGGTERAASLNRILAQAAQRLHLAMGLGSGRILLEDPDVLKSFDVRRIAPDVLLFANLGAMPQPTSFTTTGTSSPRQISPIFASRPAKHVSPSGCRASCRALRCRTSASAPSPSTSRRQWSMR